MSNDKLIETIKDAGCRVRLFNREWIGGDTAATFNYTNGPIICVATQGRCPKEIRKLLLHEFAHFHQWKCGFMKEVDSICDGWDIIGKRLDGKSVDKALLDRAVRSACLIEYDAELRSIDVAEQLGIWVNRREIYDDAHSYICGIKMSALCGQWIFYPHLGMYHEPLSPTEVIAPLTNEEKNKLLEKE